MSDFQTIAEFELRQLRNELRSVGRSRLRMAVWIISALGFASFIGLRIFVTHLRGRDAIHFDPQSAAIFGGVFVAYLGFAFALSMMPGAQFTSMAEALFAGTSQLGVRSIFVWLQLRAVWRMLARSFIFIVIIATNSTSGTGVQSARLTVLGFAVLLIPPAFAFHVTNAPARLRAIVRGCGGALMALGVATGFGLVPPLANLALAQANGAWWPVVLALLVAATGIVIPPMADPVPALFAATRPGGIVGLRFSQRPAKERKRDGGATSDWIFDMGGVWVILSGRLAAFFRIRTPRYFALGLVGWFAVGLGIGGVEQFYGRVADLVVYASAFPVVLMTCLLAAQVGRDLGIEIRNPLWWAGDATMLSRLGVDAFASLWRFIVTGAAVLAGFAAFGHVRTALAMLILTTAFVWLARCCGYLVYAYFPSSIDQRGALAGLRIIILFVLAIPVGVVGMVVGIMQIGEVLQVVLPLLVAVVQAVALLLLAARRIDGRIEAYL